MILVSGPPGSGKSTVARLLADRFPRSALVPGDVFFAFVSNGWVEPWLAAAHEQNEVVLTAAAAAAGRLVRGGYTVVHDGVVGPWFLPGFAAATGLPELGYVVLLPPEEECLRRVAARTGHGFTDPGAARHMHREFTGAAVDGRHVVPGTGPASEVADAVLDRFRAGSLRWTG